MLKGSPYPINRLANPRRALTVSLTQSLVNLLTFGALYLGGESLGLWPGFVAGGDVPGVQTGLLICFVISVALLFLYRGLMPRLLLRGYFDGVDYLRGGHPQEGIAALNAFVVQIEGNDLADRWRSVLLLDYSEYSYHEASCMALAYAHHGLGDVEAAKDWFRATLALNPGNLTAQQALEDLGGSGDSQ